MSCNSMIVGVVTTICEGHWGGLLIHAPEPQINNINSLVCESDGTALYFTDINTGKINKINLSPSSSSSSSSSSSAQNEVTRLVYNWGTYPSGITLDTLSGDILVLDNGLHCLRRYHK